MYAERKSVTVTTDESGDGTGYIPVPYGRVMTLIYTKVDYDNGVDFDVTVESTGEVIWDQDDVNASVAKYPRVAAHDTAGAEALYAASGEAVREPIVMAADRIKIVVGSGGDTKSGTFTAVIG